MTEADRLRAEFQDAVSARARGDLDPRRFDLRSAKLAVELYRAVAADRLDPDETIRVEHHVIQNHLAFNRPILRDDRQEAASFFLTDRRLLAIRCVHSAGQALTADDRDDTVIVELPLGAITAVHPASTRRWGEAGAGVVIAAVALALGPRLAITGPLLLALGAAGVAHALLFPTRWLEVLSADAPPLLIPAVASRNGRKIARGLAGRAAATIAPAAEGGAR